MMPIGDVEEYPMITPYVTWTLIGINVIVFALLQPKIPPVADLSMIPANVKDFYDTWAVIPARIAAGENWLSTISAMFMHGSWMHLGGNMLYLWIFGDNVEHAFGRGRYLLFYLGAGLIATLVQVWLFADSMIWNLGASGAIAGVLGAYIVLFPKSLVNVLVGRSIARLPALLVIGVWFGLQALSGASQLVMASTGQGGGGVAFWAHIGGFVAGVALAFMFGGRKKAAALESGEWVVSR